MSNLVNSGTVKPGVTIITALDMDSAPPPPPPQTHPHPTPTPTPRPNPHPHPPPQKKNYLDTSINLVFP